MGQSVTTEDKELTRRGLLTGAIGAAATAVLGARRAGAAADKVRIVRVESGGIWKGNRRDPQVISEMLNKGLIEFTGETTPDAAWRRYFKPEMRVGLKINLLGRPLMYTPREITEAVAAGVVLAGVKPDEVIVWDRWGDHFPPTEYRPGTKGPSGERIEVGARYDSRRALRASGGVAPIDTMAVDRTDVTVNLPLLKDHSGSGVTLALKNIAFGCYDHHGRAHDNNCDPYIAEAYQHYLTQTRVPLIILDATEACFDGGPQPGSRSQMWRENALYIATDPVALDAVCRKVIMDKRRASGLGDKTRQCRHIETAAAKGLGVLDLNQIEVVTITV
jgi:hypothetical protein